MSRLKLKFILANLSEYTKNVKFFEERAAHIHNTGDKIEDILVSQLRKVLDDSEINELDEDGNLVRKSRDKVINIDLNEAKKLSNNKVFIGREVEKEIEAMGLTPKKPQLRWFFDLVRKCHLEACKYMLKYFKTTLSNPVVSYLSGLNPSAQSHVTTPIKLKELVREYSKVVDNIQFVGGIDAIKEEIGNYVTDEDVKDLPKEDYETFWTSVKEISDGQSNWKKYEILPRFALAMATRYDANAEVERSFSLMNLVHQNTQRNRMSQETLDAHLHIRSKVESKENREGCQKCLTSKDHCHCDKLQITEDLRISCKKAWKVLREKEVESKTVKDNFAEKSVAVKEKALKDEKERIEKFKEKVMKRSYFCKDDLFVPIYKKQSNKEREKSKTDENKNKRSLPVENNNSSSKKKKNA